MIPGSTAKSHDAKETSKDCLGCRDSGLGLFFFYDLGWLRRWFYGLGCRFSGVGISKPFVLVLLVILSKRGSGLMQEFYLSSCFLFFACMLYFKISGFTVP